MALTARQSRLYIHSVQVYRRNPVRVGEDWHYEAAGTVSCYLFSTTNADKTSEAGRLKDDNLFTYDKLHCDIDADIRADDVLWFDYPGHPDHEKWFSVMGEPKGRPSSGNRRANLMMVYLNRTTAPYVS